MTATLTRPEPRDAHGCVRVQLDGRAAAPAPPSTRRSLVRVAAATAIAGLLLAAGVFHVLGGRWLDVVTPSMGTAAPVGSLVLTVPTTADQLATGDVVSFHPDQRPDTLYTHRVVEVVGSGAGTTVRTRGDINGAVDPWTTGDAQLLGRAAVIVPGLGWLLRALPTLALGGLVLWSLTRVFAPLRWRGAVRMLGASLLFSVLVVRLRPFVGITQLATTGENGTTRVSLVSTGLLPVRVRAVNLEAVPLDLRSGQTGVLTLTGRPAGGGRVDVATALHFSPLGWAVMVLVWLSPLLWVLLVGLTPPRHGRVDG